jgi:oligopeptide transport system substrate-binding protein
MAASRPPPIARSALTIAVATFLFVSAVGADTPAHLLRVGMPLMPETLDPARVDNAQAAMIMAGIYDTLYVFDPLARPTQIVPLAATELPEISSDYRTISVHVRSGLFFTPHPSFGGKPRELVAGDFAYAFKRIVDPKIRSPSLYLIAGKIEGLDELARRAQQAGTRFDYDAPVPGLIVVDRRTLRIRLNSPDPTFKFVLASVLVAGVAREVVEAEGDTYGQRPVGTGAFLVTLFTPGERLVLTRNPGFRDMHWEDLLTLASRKAQGTHPMRGKRLPGLDRIEFSSTPEASAELLALRRGELDLIYLKSPELATQNGQLKPELPRDGVSLVRDPSPDVVMRFFSMRDPVVGGDALEKVALRRAIAMAFDGEEYSRVFDAGFSTVQQQVVPEGIDGHISGYRNPNPFSPDAANALLDRFGYKKGSDGYRLNPDGSPLTITSLSGTSSDARRGAEFTKRMLDRIGIRVSFEAVTIAERLKRMDHCQYGMAGMDFGLDIPDGTNAMTNFWGKSIGSLNMSCFADPIFDAAYEKALVMPSGPERTELFRTMQMRLDAMVPAHLLPMGPTLLLKRSSVVGPFGTINDWLQLITLGVNSSASER